MVDALPTVRGVVLEAEQAESCELGEQLVSRKSMRRLPLVRKWVDRRLYDVAHGLAKHLVLWRELHAGYLTSVLGMAPRRYRRRLGARKRARAPPLASRERILAN